MIIVINWRQRSRFSPDGLFLIVEDSVTIAFFFDVGTDLLKLAATLKTGIRKRRASSSSISIDKQKKKTKRNWIDVFLMIDESPLTCLFFSPVERKKNKFSHLYQILRITDEDDMRIFSTGIRLTRQLSTCYFRIRWSNNFSFKFLLRKLFAFFCANERKSDIYFCISINEKKKKIRDVWKLLNTKDKKRQDTKH